MEFKDINSYVSAYEYAEKRRGVPKVPFAKFWIFYPEDEERLVDIARQVQQVFNMVQSDEPFKINYIAKFKDGLFDIDINPGGIISFKIDQDSVEQRQTAQQIDEQLDAHQKKKERQTSPQKKKDNLFTEFKLREEKILAEIKSETEAEVKVEALAKVETEAEVETKAKIEALVEALAEAKAEALVAKDKAEALVAKTKVKVEAEASIKIKIFGYSVFEYIK